MYLSSVKQMYIKKICPTLFKEVEKYLRQRRFGVRSLDIYVDTTEKDIAPYWHGDSIMRACVGVCWIIDNLPAKCVAELTAWRFSNKSLKTFESKVIHLHCDKIMYREKLKKPAMGGVVRNFVKPYNSRVVRAAIKKFP